MLDYAEYAQHSAQQSSFVDLGFTHHGMVLVSFVQSVIRSFNKHLAPLIETRSQKTCEHTDQYLLNKRRVHALYSSSRDASVALFTRIPTVGFA
jgi:hypothetical protein